MPLIIFIITILYVESKRIDLILARFYLDNPKFRPRSKTTSKERNQIIKMLHQETTDYSDINKWNLLHEEYDFVEREIKLNPKFSLIKHLNKNPLLGPYFQSKIEAERLISQILS